MHHALASFVHQFSLFWRHTVCAHRGCAAAGKVQTFIISCHSNGSCSNFMLCKYFLLCPSIHPYHVTHSYMYTPCMLRMRSSPGILVSFI